MLRARTLPWFALLLGACPDGGGRDDSGPASASTIIASTSGETTATSTAEPLPTSSSPPTTSTATPDTTAAPDTTTTDDTTTGDPALPVGRIEIGMWCGPPLDQLTDERFAEIAAAGFTIVANACDGTTYVPAYNNTMLALAQAHGMKAFVSDQRALAAAVGQDVETNLDALVADYGAAPALLAYHLVDEPSAGAFANLGVAVAGLRARDPAHPGIINLLPDYASPAQFGVATYDEYLASFLAQVAPDSFTYDHYNFLIDGTDGPTWFANLALARGHSLQTATPFGVYIQAISYNGHRATTGPEKRWAALHTLAYGGTAVLYFTYWTPPQTQENFGDGIIGANGLPSSQYADVTAINRTLTLMGRYLGAATSTGVFHNGPLDLYTAPRLPTDPVYIPGPAPISVGLFAIDAGAYALLVNRDHVNATSTDVYLSAAPSIMDPATGEFVPADATQDDNGFKVHLDLAPGDGALFHLPGPVPAGPPGAEAYVGTVRADLGTLSVVDDAFGAQPLRSAGWDDCPVGTTNLGKQLDSNGFWLCVRDDLAGRVFHLGNVVADTGHLYRFAGGTISDAGLAGWDTCPTGAMIGRVFTSDGFWLCMDP